jgi:uncharacterized protein involved in outer membrane biogenesis
MKNFLIGLVVVVVVAFIGLNFAAKSLLAKGIESAVGAPVKVDKFKLDLFNNQVGIYGLVIGNPEGFQESSLATIPEIFVHLNLKALLKKRVHVRELKLNLDEITVEKNAAGQVNLTQIGAVKQQFAPKDGTAPDKASSEAKTADKGGPAIDVQIDLVDLSLGRARYVDNSKSEQTVREFALNVKNSTFRDVTDPRQITVQVVLKTLRQVGLNALTPDFGQLSAGLEAQAQAKMADAKAAMGDLAQKFKMPFGGSQAATN